MKRFLTIMMIFGLFGTAQANLVVNGSFEEQVVVATANDGVPFYRYSIVPYSTITGWTFTNERALVHNSVPGYWRAQDGNQFINIQVLGSGVDPYGEAYQVLNTSPGQQYRLSFSVAGDYGLDNPPTDDVLGVYWDGVQVGTVDPAASYDKVIWTQKEYIVTATKTQTELRFKDENVILSYIGPLLDAVSVEPIGDFSHLYAFTLGPRAQELNPNKNNTLKLISGTWQEGGGYAFLTNPIMVTKGYSTQFSFRISDLIGSGADWLRFVVSKVPFGVMVSAVDTVDVEFDIYNNGARDNYNANHIGLNYDGTWQLVQPVSTSFKNGEIWNVWIDYDGEVMKVYASTDSEKPLFPNVSHIINVAEKIGTSKVYVGFYAASGAYGADFDILRWSFTPIPETVSIDVKPDSVNWKKTSLISISIFSTTDFNAVTQIDPNSLKFGFDGSEDSLNYCVSKPKDLNRDGIKDLLCYFYTKQTGLQCGYNLGILKGFTFDGLPIMGSDSVTLIQCK